MFIKSWKTGLGRPSRGRRVHFPVPRSKPTILGVLYMPNQCLSVLVFACAGGFPDNLTDFQLGDAVRELFIGVQQYLKQQIKTHITLHTFNRPSASLKIKGFLPPSGCHKSLRLLLQCAYEGLAESWHGSISLGQRLHGSSLFVLSLGVHACP